MNAADSPAEDMSIQELELRIHAANIALKWLNSSDPMLQQDEYRPLVHPAKMRVKAELVELMEVCRRKKVQRDHAEREFVEHVEIGLKPGKLDARGLV
jgi:hypothetical protein